MAPENPSKSRLGSTALWLTAFFVIAVFLRVFFSLHTGFDNTTQRYVFTGNDPYYEDRHLTHVVETGSNLDQDPSINYPTGRGNPNPPLWVWMTAPFAALVQDGHVSADPMGLTINLSGAIFGALIVFPVYMLGREVFGRRAGLWASFLIAFSAPHIERTIFGFAKHDAATIFFVTLATAFMVRALRIQSPRDGTAKPLGFGASVKAALAGNRPSFLYASLAGLSLASAALMWKGYDYVLAILGLALLVQLVADHMRRRDSTTTWLLYLVPLVLVTVIPYLVYYQFFPGFMATTIIPGLYVLVGALVLGLVLVPTRGLPSILVFPALIVATALALLAMYFVSHETFQVIRTGLGYFVQSKLYSTIAEAQRPAVGFVAANFAFFAFLLAPWGFARAVKGAWKGKPGHVLLTASALVSFFLCFAASRFLMNAAPAFAVLAGAVTVTVLEKTGILATSARFGEAKGLARLGTGKAALGLLFAALIIVPSMVEGIDASTSTDFEAENHVRDSYLGRQMFGAFGINFDLKDNGWIDAMHALSQRDTGLSEGDRPGVIAWWDYGHWNVGIGQHPTVADPFQDHYELAGRFLASESEQEGVAWMTILFLEHDRNVNGGHFSPGVQAALVAVDPALPQAVLDTPVRGYDANYRAFTKYVHGDATFSLYDQVSKAIGKRIGYFAADLRMFPESASSSGIFYAPVYLANKNPDDFTHVSYTKGQITLKREEYTRDANNNSVRLDAPRFVNAQNPSEVWTVYQGYAYPPSINPRTNPDTNNGIAVYQGGQLVRDPRFDSTMFAKAFPAIPTAVPTGEGLSHWRVVHQSTASTTDNSGRPLQYRTVVLLEYYTGVKVTGKLVDDSNHALAGYTVGFQDGSGATHATSRTAADGTFTVTAPFAEKGDLTFLVKQGQSGTLFADNGTKYQFSRDDAEAGKTVELGSITLQHGTLAGHVFIDANGDGAFQAGNDTALQNATVTVDGVRDVRTDGSGAFPTQDVAAGNHQVTARMPGYENGTRTITVKAGQATQTVDIPMTVKASQVNVTLQSDGKAVGGVSLQLNGPTKTSVAIGGFGSGLVNLLPGTYTAHLDQNVTGADNAKIHYTADQTFTVPFGGAPVAVTVTATKA